MITAKELLSKRLSRSAITYSSFLALLLTIVDSPLHAEETTAVAPESDGIFPLYRDWFEDRGISMPLPYGIGGAVVYMKREIEIEDVRVKIGNLPPQSISDRIDFDMNNETIMASSKFDVWVLPFLNVYAMLGRADSEARMKSTLMIPPPGGGETIPIKTNLTQSIDGTMWGGGVTLAAGHGRWLGILDASYVRSDIEEFDGELDIWMASARIGQELATDIGRVMLWGGLFYVDTHRTLEFSEELPLLGTITVEVDQRTKNPITYQLGGSLQVTKNWEVLAEIGSNFDDASLMVVSAAYRF
jgi:hypothetical protein